MSTEDGWPGGADNSDGLAEFAAELKILAETVLERVEPVLRAAGTGQTDWSSCSWCPICAAAALVRGEHHDVLTAVAEHGTAIVTVLREALAGVPVAPVMPDPETGAPHDHSAFFADQDAAGPTTPEPGAPTVSSDGQAVATQHSTSTGRKRASYVGIPVTIKA